MACCPAAAPFERLARAKAAEAAEAFDAVLVDVPPVAAIQAVAAVNACDRTALVAPATTRGVDGVERMRARVRDLGGAVDAVVATRGESAVADASVPRTDAGVAGAPTAPADDEFGDGVARATAAVLGRDVERPADGGLFG